MPCTNVAEWIFHGDLQRLLHLCGEREEIGEEASDYQRFSAFCRCFPLLVGNRLARAIDYSLVHDLEINLPVSTENRDEIWSLAADRLLAFPHPKPDWEKKTEMIADDEPLQAHVSLCFDAPVFAPHDAPELLSLCHSKEDSLEAWQEKITLALRDSKESVFCLLPRDYHFCAPDPYHALKELQKREGERNNDLLFSQLMRYLAIAAQDRDIPLVLQAECDVREVLRLLEYTESRVGLPELVLTISSLEDALCLLPFATRKAPKATRFAVCPSAFATKVSYNAFLKTYAAEYPIGALCMLHKKRTDVS